MKRVGVLGFLHESNTFLSVPTDYEHFASTAVLHGKALVDHWRNKHHELGGMIAGLTEAGLEIAPGMSTFAIPSGTITAAAYDRIARELVESVQSLIPVDAFLLALHGATASAEFPDADGELLRRIRALVGPDLPIFVTLDLHANISQTMAQASNAIVVYRSNPHLDQFARGKEAALLLARTLAGEVKPVQHLETPPLLIHISRQHTQVEPARGLYQDIEEVLCWPGILSASVAMGFYYADVDEMGVTFLAIADGDAALARKAARFMADRAWARRELFTANLPTPAEAVSAAIASEKKPVVLMDIGDNVGAGSPADGTILLAEVIRQGGRNSLTILYDAEAVQQCVKAGILANVDLLVGAKTDKLHGSPVPICGKVRTIADGIFVEPLARHGGWGGGDQGVTVVVETAEQHSIILTSRRMAPVSLEQVFSLGVNPARKDILIVKGVVAPRAAYEPIAGELILVDTPGVTSDNPGHFEFKRRRKPLFPIEKDAEYLVD